MYAIRKQHQRGNIEYQVILQLQQTMLLHYKPLLPYNLLQLELMLIIGNYTNQESSVNVKRSYVMEP